MATRFLTADITFFQQNKIPQFEKSRFVKKLVFWPQVVLEKVA
jgi:hypothetical protein